MGRRISKEQGFPARKAVIAGAFACACLVAPLSAAHGQTDVAGEEDTPWYETFSLSLDEPSDVIAGEVSSFDWESPDQRWGFTLDLHDDPTEAFEVDDLSAEAYLNLGGRFRIGTQFRFTAPEDLVLGAEPDERAPEVKFESALRF